jgi:hypothetical protein
MMDTIIGNTDARTPWTVQVQGPHEVNADDHEEKLVSKLQSIPKDAHTLRIEGDTPSDTEWSLPGNHFTSVRHLEMDTGWNKGLNDAKMPIHWPLEKLNVGSACGKVFRSPLVLEGRIQHLVLFLTCELRFEGPTKNQLRLAQEQAIARGDTQPEYLTLHEATPEERKIELICMPKLVSQWFSEKYSTQSGILSTGPIADRGQTADFVNPRKRCY